MKFSFKNIKKKYLETEMIDGTIIHLKMPDLGTMQEIMEMQSGLSGSDFGMIFKMISKMLSSNLEGKKISEAEVKKTFDIEEAFAFIQIYTEFLTDITGQKN